MSSSATAAISRTPTVIDNARPRKDRRERMSFIQKFQARCTNPGSRRR
jgi:hypothetical protein